MAKPPTSDLDIISSDDKRSGVEERWVSFQPYFLTKGYRLRPRYNPDWIPSWRTTGLEPSECEDSIDSMPLRVLDATRIKDNRQVVIKILKPEQGGEGKEELAVLQHFATPPLRDDASNHVVPCWDTFPIPGEEHGCFVVMPLLGRYDEPAFDTISEVHDFLQQLFEGLEFMHKNDTAHCDIATANIMMESHLLYDEPFHPVYQGLSLDTKRRIYPRHSRLEKHVRYYFIDMGFATWFRDTNSPRLITGKFARILAPEQKIDKPYDPFLVDVYQLGTVIKQDLILQNKAFNFLQQIADEMTQPDPSVRPPLSKARQSMNTAFLGLCGISYRWPLVPRKAGFRAKGIYFVWGIVSELRYWLQRLLGLFLRVRI
ncbi:kinase-like domain-containing protein [Rhizoctonia solani]|nr:kinase-like domain-containing protein [Rhizoctonia solani]